MLYGKILADGFQCRLFQTADLCLGNMDLIRHFHLCFSFKKAEVDNKVFIRYKYKKLQGTQTQETQSDARHRVWKKIKLHGTQTHATLSSQNTLGSGRNCRILKQGCRRFCFVIIIPYPDRKANICSIRLRAEKGEV